MTVLISPNQFQAVIFDLDGVITKTARVHAAAWKRMFDEFLKERTDTEFVPFDEKDDYLTYVDGKPRYDGIKSFLESRDIHLHWGEPDDSKDKQTICGLANKKNELFIRELEESGVEVYESTVTLIHALREKGIKIAVISSSKNCTPILKKVNLLHLFDAKIDGIDAEKRKIKGKPAPDVFLEAAKLIGAEVKKSVVVEDAISGVQAGRAGNFGLVIGVDRTGQAEALKENGADVVVKDLSEVYVGNSGDPNVLDSIEEFKKQIQNKKLVIFLDYDGTLTPIVKHPDLAVLSDEMRNTLEMLGSKTTIAIISGRDCKDVEEKVGISDIFYAGSHGFDIAGPDEQHFENEEAKKFLSVLEEAEKELRIQVEDIYGAWVERKKYSIAIHFRQAAPEDEPAVEKIVDDVHSKHSELRKVYGKKIFELQPNIDWDKGKALYWLLKLLGLDREDVIPMYLGDDVADEDVFKALAGHGIGIAVQDESKPTAAQYTLKDPDQVRQFFQKLLEVIPNG